MDKRKKHTPLEWFMIVMFAVSVCCVIIQVVSRRVFNNSLPWCSEVCRYAFLWVVFIGTAVMLKENGHIAIDLALTATPPRVRGVILLLNQLCILIFTGILTVLGVRLVLSTNGSLSSALRLPINLILYLALPLGMGMSCLIMLGKVWRQLRVLLGRQDPPALDTQRKGE